MTKTAWPHSREAEESLLGSVLINPAAIVEKEVARVAPDDFYIVLHQDIWRAFQKMGKEIDPIVVGEKTNSTDYLLSLISQTPSALRAAQYAEVIRDFARRRRDIQIAQTILQQAQKGDIDRAGILESLVKNDPIDGGAEDIRGHVEALIKDVEERAKNPTDVWGMRSGFPDLDRRIGGLHREQTLLLAAPPGIGKSVLAMQIAKNVAASGTHVVIYSFEMSAKRVLMRLLSAESGIPTRAMSTGYMSDYWDDFYVAAQQLHALPIHISDIYGMTTFSVRADLARMTIREDVGLVVVDYLNKLLDSDGGDDLSNTKLKAQRMQGICREFGVHGILIQSMTKEGMTATVPKMAAMSGPADVAHEGDNVFLMGKHPEEENCVQLYPAKMRDGDLGRSPIKLQWAKAVPMFVTPTSTEQAGIPEYYHD